MAPPTDINPWPRGLPFFHGLSKFPYPPGHWGGRRPPRTWTRGLGGLPFFHGDSNFLIRRARGRCHCLGAVSTVAVDFGPFPGRGAGSQKRDPWPGGPPLLSRMAQISLSTKVLGGAPYFMDTRSSPLV